MSMILARPNVLKAVATKDLIVKGNRVDNVVLNELLLVEGDEDEDLKDFSLT
ncbi:hypothetical protein YC2023_088912 [Brassica napus]